MLNDTKNHQQTFSIKETFYQTVIVRGGPGKRGPSNIGCMKKILSCTLLIQKSKNFIEYHQGRIIVRSYCVSSV